MAMSFRESFARVNSKDPTVTALTSLDGHGHRGLHHYEGLNWVLLTDNAFAYRYSTDLKNVCASLGAVQKFIRPHCPWQNGKVERLNRTLATEWAYRQVFTSNEQRAAALAPWIEYYNTERHHSALGGKPPISRVLPT